MATRSVIGVDKDNGMVEYIYCHWDGYPSYVGRLLMEHWDTNEKISDLMNLGDLSVLGEEIGEKVDFDNFDTDSIQCLAYGRDRGDADVSSIVIPISEYLKNVSDYHGAEYAYLFHNNEWYVCDCFSDTIGKMKEVIGDNLNNEITVDKFISLVGGE